MLPIKAIVQANKNWVERAGQRWDAAALAIDSGAYESKHFFRDALRSVVGDPFDWTLDILRETQSAPILIDAKGVATKKSGLIPVRNPQQTKITDLSRLGGTEQMKLGTHVVLDKPTVPPAPPGSIPDGNVQVSLLGLDATIVPGQYLGFLFEDNLPISYVIVLR